MSVIVTNDSHAVTHIDARGSIIVTRMLQLSEDGEIIATASIASVVSVGEDVSRFDARTQAIVAAAWTPEILERVAEEKRVEVELRGNAIAALKREISDAQSEGRGPLVAALTVRLEELESGAGDV